MADQAKKRKIYVVVHGFIQASMYDGCRAVGKTCSPYLPMSHAKINTC